MENNNSVPTVKRNPRVFFFDFLYENHLFADGELVLLFENDTNSKKKKRNEYKYIVHKVVWTASSAYFKAQMIRWESDQKIMYYTVNSAEKEAFDALVRFFYYGDIENASDPVFVINVMNLADRLGCFDAMDLAANYLSLIPVQNISFQAIMHFFESSPVVLANKQCHETMVIALLEIIGCLDTILFQNDQNIIRLEMFLRLPFNAVLSFFNTSAIGAMNEDTVLGLAIHWCNDSNNRPSDPERLTELANCIRVSNLSLTMLMTGVPYAPWIIITSKQKLAILQYHFHKENISDTKSFCEEYDLPLCWFHEREYLCHNIDDAGVLFNFQFLITTEQFNTWINSNEQTLTVHSSTSVYHKFIVFESTLMIDRTGTVTGIITCHWFLSKNTIVPVNVSVKLDVIVGNNRDKCFEVVQYCSERTKMKWVPGLGIELSIDTLKEYLCIYHDDDKFSIIVSVLNVKF